MKRFVAMFLCFLILFSLPVYAAFIDVDDGSWYSDAVQYVYENGLMSGVSEDSFAPRANFSRAMLAQVLYRMNGSPYVDSYANFADTSINAWYADAVTWAYESRIMSGYGNNKFGPNDSVTREQLAMVLYRYDGSDGLVDSRILNVFNDVSFVSGWAKDAVAWAVDRRLISGSGMNLMPRKGANRAEVAQILMSYRTHTIDDLPAVDMDESYVDYHNGKVCVKYVGDNQKIRFRIKKGNDETIYVLNPNERFEYTIPYGVGNYELTLYENIEGTRYRRVITKSVIVTEYDWNQALVFDCDYFDVVPGMSVIVNGIWNDNLSQRENARHIYDWICSNVVYDGDRMEMVTTGYLPDLRHALYDRKAICLDYAALYSTMLRYKGIPAQIVVGNYDDYTCHAWSKVCVDGEWIYVDSTFGASSLARRDKYFDFDGSSCTIDYLF